MPGGVSDRLRSRASRNARRVPTREPPRASRTPPSRSASGRCRAARARCASGVRPTACHAPSPPIRPNETSAPSGDEVMFVRPGNARPETRKDGIAGNRALRLGGEHERFAVPIEIREPQRFRQRDVARRACAARSPRPQTAADRRGDHDRCRGRITCAIGAARAAGTSCDTVVAASCSNALERLRHLAGAGVAAARIAIERARDDRRRARRAARRVQSGQRRHRLLDDGLQ